MSQGVQQKTPSVIAEGGHQGASTTSESDIPMAASGIIAKNDLTDKS